jgi:Cupin domain.
MLQSRRWLPVHPHTHTFEDEVYYVLEGEMTFLLGNYVETAKKKQRDNSSAQHRSRHME